MSSRINMMKSFSMAALLLASGTFVACSSSNDDIVAELTNNDAQQVYTMTVQATKGDDAFTRGLVLNEDGTKLSVKWNEGEKVYVLQNVGNDTWTVMGALTATPDADDPTKATLTGSFGLNKVNTAATALRFVLHKAWMNYNYQEGILIGEGDTPLSSIEDGYDYASCKISSDGFTIANNTISIPNGITLKSEQAIVKFILTEADGTTPVEANSLIIHDENNGIVLSEDYTKPSNDGRTVKDDLQIDISSIASYYGIFVAINNNNPEKTNYTLTAHAPEGLTYSFTTKSPVKFEKGKYYVVKVKMNADNAVDLGLSVLWANMNVGASRAFGYPEAQYGGYFAWGATDQQATYDWAYAPFCTVDGTTHSWSKYTSNGTLATSSNYIDYSDCDDAARYNWHGSWRMPTQAEWRELENNCNLTWVEDYNGTGIAGVRVTSKREGYTDKSIFLPAAGYKDNRTETGNPGLQFEKQYVQYWSSTFDSPNQKELAVSEKIQQIDTEVIKDLSHYQRCLGMPIRPVMEQVQVSAEVQSGREHYGDAVELSW